MAKLLLIKHAAPAMAPQTPSHRWVLSEEGRRACDPLAEELRLHRVSRIYSSLEPKALETAALVAMRLGLEVRPRAGLQENDRSGLGFVERGQLERLIAGFFDRPDERVIGAETAAEALQRFEQAVRSLAAEEPEGTAVVVTHGTVLTLLIAKYNPISPRT
ncbi:MAG: histidine phosphatase family protein, partial [Caulobacteraceae bacterium]